MQAHRCLQNSLDDGINLDPETVVRDAVKAALQSGDNKVQGIRKILHTITCCSVNAYVSADLRQWRVFPVNFFLEGLALTEYTALCLSLTEKVA